MCAFLRCFRREVDAACVGLGLLDVYELRGLGLVLKQ